MAKSKTEAKPQKKSSDKIKEELGKPFERPLMDDPDKPNVITKDETFDDPGIAKQANQLRFPKIEILKGKILKGDKVEVEYTRRDNLEEKAARCTYEHTAPPRRELKQAFADLAIHAALLGEFIPLYYVDETLEPDPEQIKNFNVSGFTIVGGDDDTGVILTAQKTLKSGKTLGFNTPKIRFDDQSENAYPHLDELSECIDQCKKEMANYLDGKHAEDPQLKMDLN